jgi:hypothetical protein
VTGTRRDGRRSPSARRTRTVRAVGAAFAVASAAVARAQNPNRVTFSIDWHGPTVGRPASGSGTPITEGDILRPVNGVPTFGPMPRPEIFLTGGQLGLQRYPTCVGHQGGTPCGVEVDALSYGTDTRFGSAAGQRTKLYFSVEEHSIGHPGSVLAPSVRSESASPVFDVPADVFVSLDLPPGPIPPNAIPPENVAVLDGDGLQGQSSRHYRGVGLVEPDPPGLPPDPGDNLDALDMHPVPGPTGTVYFSLDASFVDPALGIPNSGSANAQGVPPGAVLAKPISGGSITIYAQPSQLGLDLGGPGTDDLDALILWENGTPGFQPSLVPNDWNQAGGRDMLLFSVRRGSAVIGQPDSIFGLPIMPGDILTTPFLGPGAPLVGPRPGIFIPAEDLGLATTRAGGGGSMDELDAASSDDEAYYDCNNNGVEDSVDIAQGSSADANNNGIPDECERSWSRFCLCSSGLGPCGNDDAAAGCANSTGMGASLDASGSTSWEADDLVLTATHMPANKLGIWMLSSVQVQTVLGDGLRCVGNPFHRFGAFNSGPAGAASKGPGIIGSACSTLPPSFCIHVGATWNFQVWYRNLSGPCGAGSNLSNAMEVAFSP